MAKRNRESEPPGRSEEDLDDEDLVDEISSLIFYTCDNVSTCDCTASDSCFHERSYAIRDINAFAKGLLAVIKKVR